ncbi:hypothetical protein BOX15_Mlig034286g1 [Macrostomum lignano]|uniref:Uncharacterized protein n=1 Tax=Macrostomum lignano TaxID=282301 RepID=A0A267DCS9_9PLAT|nr:hypothetical protein BOX15_Mlig034286g1 [Macrostomum lignano]
MTEATQAGSRRCSLATCSEAAAGAGAQTLQPLCQRHLDRDSDRVREIHARVEARLQPLRLVRDLLRTDSQALEAKLQVTEDLLNAAIESLMKHKEAVTNRLTATTDAARQKLSDFAVLQEFDSSMAAAESANNLRGIFEQCSRMELECSDLENAVSGGDEQGRLKLGDVCGALRDLQLSIDRQFEDVMKLFESVSPLREEKQSICEFHSEIQELDGAPAWVSCCSNTKGFSADASGSKVVKAESAVDGAQMLPEPCLFVAFDLRSDLDYLLACSIDGSVRLKVQVDLDWFTPITGLSCDSKRQALYISQKNVVKVSDLSGQVSLEINSSSLGRPVRFMGLTCSSDKIIALDKSGSEMQLLCIDKDSGQLQTCVSVGGVPSSPDRSESMSVIDHAVLITDWAAKKIYKVCIVSGQLISTYPTSRSRLDELLSPAGVVAHRSGLVFVSEYNRHVVRVMQSDGTVLQTVGVEGEAGRGRDKMHCPCVLGTVEGDSELLAVCQQEGLSIRFYRVSTGSAV